MSSARTFSCAVCRVDEGRSSKCRVCDNTFDRRGRSDVPLLRIDMLDESKSVLLRRDIKALDRTAEVDMLAVVDHV